MPRSERVSACVYTIFDLRHCSAMVFFFFFFKSHRIVIRTRARADVYALQKLLNNKYARGKKKNRFSGSIKRYKYTHR